MLFTAVLAVCMLWSMHQRRGLAIPSEARRVLLALERASLAAVQRRAVRLPLMATGALALLLGAQCMVLPGGSLSITSIVAPCALFGLGLASSLGLAVFCGHHVRKHAFLGTAGAAHSIERCLTVTTSSVALLAIAAEVFAVLAAASVFTMLWWILRGSNYPAAAAIDPAHLAARISPYFGIGAVVGSLAIQHSGTACVGATKLAGMSSFEMRTALAPSDPRNPSVLIEVMGSQLGSITPRILDAFVGGILVLAVSVQVASIAPALGWPQGTEKLALIPVLARAFGLLSVLVALLTLRTHEHEDARNPFIRGQVVAHVVQGSALVGLLVWLVGSFSWVPAVAAALGLILAPALGLLRARLLTRPRAARTAIDETQALGPLPSIDGFGAALSVALVPIAFYASLFGLFSVWFDHVPGIDSHRAIAILLGLALPSSLTVWNQLPLICRDLAAIGSLSASVGRVALSDEASLRTRKVNEAFERVGLATTPVLGDGGILLCCLAALVSSPAHLRTPMESASVLTLLSLSLWVFLPGALGAVEAFRTSSKAAKTQLNEVDRQLRGMRRDGTRVIVPEDFVPSYRSCVELLSRDSAHGGLFFALAALAFPAFTAYLSHLPEKSASSSSVSLASYASIAAAVGLFAMHVGHAASAANLSAPRGSLPPRTGPSSVPVSDSLRMIEFLGHSLGVSVPLLTKAAALVTLAFSASLL